MFKMELNLTSVMYKGRTGFSNGCRVSLGGTLAPKSDWEVSGSCPDCLKTS